MLSVFLIISLNLLPLIQGTQQTAPQNPSPHQEGVIERGDHVMGFSHEKTMHHFRLFKDGGEIVVAVNDPKDKASIDQIRTHLGHIAGMFSAGNFHAPMLIHDTNPPGAATMTRLKDQIHYKFAETESGARIRIVASSAEATDAVHAFLLFQIVDHQTGDSPAIAQEPAAP